MTYIYNTSLQEESSAGHPIARVLQSRVAVSMLTGLVIAQLKLQCIYYWAQCWPLLPRYELWMYYERPSEQPCIFLLKFDLTTVHYSSPCCVPTLVCCPMVTFTFSPVHRPNCCAFLIRCSLLFHFDVRDEWHHWMSLFVISCYLINVMICHSKSTT